MCQHGADNLEQFALTVWQAADGLVLFKREAGDFHQFLKLFLEVRALLVEEGLEEAHLVAEVSTQQQIVPNAGTLQEARRLERPAEAHPGAVVRRHARDVLVQEGDGAAVDVIDAADQVENGGFAGAVRSDQTSDGAGVHFDVHILGGDDATEALAYTVQFKHRFHDSASLSLSEVVFPPVWPWVGAAAAAAGFLRCVSICRKCFTMPAMPMGMTTMMMMMPKP